MRRFGLFLLAGLLLTALATANALPPGGSARALLTATLTPSATPDASLASSATVTPTAAGTTVPSDAVSPTAFSLLNLTLTPAVYSDELIIGQDMIPLNYGDLVSGAIQTTQEVYYTFEGQVGERVTITMTSSEFDTYLVLRDAYGNELAADDDSAGNLDSRIAAFTIPNEDTYTIVATTFSHRVGSGSVATGNYLLSLELTQIETIAYNTPVTGRFTVGYPNALYTFQATQGDVIAITVSADSFAPYVILNDSSNYQVAYSGYNTGRTAVAGPYTVPQSGEYTIMIQNQNSYAEGEFVVAVHEVSLSAISIDQPIEVTINEASPAYFTFNGTTGEIIDIAVDSNNSVDTSLRIQGPGGYEVFMDEDSGEGLDPLLSQMMLQQSGPYVVIVEPFADSGTGTVTLTVRYSALPILDNNPMELATNPITRRALASFSATSGETVRITLEGLTSAQSSVSITQSGVTYYSVNSGSTNQLTFDVFLPMSGDILLSIEDQGYTSMLVTVRLERLGMIPTLTPYYGTQPPGYPTPFYGTPLPPGFPPPPAQPTLPTLPQTLTPTPTDSQPTPTATPR